MSKRCTECADVVTQDLDLCDACFEDWARWIAERASVRGHTPDIDASHLTPQ